MEKKYFVFFPSYQMMEQTVDGQTDRKQEGGWLNEETLGSS